MQTPLAIEITISKQREKRREREKKAIVIQYSMVKALTITTYT